MTIILIPLLVALIILGIYCTVRAVQTDDEGGLYSILSLGYYTGALCIMWNL